jgi:hypothetical protein
VRTIANDILTWSWFSEPHGYDFNGFLITDRSGNLSIDPVEPSEQVLHELVQRGVSRNLLTNRNHVRAANRLRASTGARTAIHPDDAAYARGQGAELDDELQVGEKIGALVAVGVPGKSPGEVAFYWPERKLLGRFPPYRLYKTVLSRRPTIIAFVKHTLRPARNASTTHWPRISRSTSGWLAVKTIGRPERSICRCGHTCVGPCDTGDSASRSSDAPATLGSSQIVFIRLSPSAAKSPPHAASSASTGLMLRKKPGAVHTGPSFAFRPAGGHGSNRLRPY